jgi:hypothetical protein
MNRRENADYVQQTIDGSNYEINDARRDACKVGTQLYETGTIISM